MVGLRFLLIISILWRFLKGPGYFRRVAKWNSSILHQVLLYFLKNEYKFIGENVVEFFEINKQDNLMKT